MSIRKVKPRVVSSHGTISGLVKQPHVCNLSEHQLSTYICLKFQLADLCIFSSLTDKVSCRIILNFASLTPKGVPVLWQDVSPVEHISHFLVSNVQSKFYRLDLVFFLNSNNQSKVLHFCFVPSREEIKKSRRGGLTPLAQRATRKQMFTRIHNNQSSH